MWCGRSQHPYDAAYSTWLRERLPQASVAVVPNSGNFPHLDDPDRFAALLAGTAVDVAVRVRRTGIALLAAVLVRLDPRLEPADRITAILEALTVTDSYAVLAGAHRWSADDYESWLARSIGDALEATARRSDAP